MLNLTPCPSMHNTWDSSTNVVVVAIVVVAVIVPVVGVVVVV